MLLTMRESKQVRRMVLAKLKGMTKVENNRDIVVTSQPILKLLLITLNSLD